PLTELAGRIERYVDQDGVTGAALVDRDGQVLTGRLPFTSRGFAGLFQAAHDLVTGAEPPVEHGETAAVDQADGATTTDVQATGGTDVDDRTAVDDRSDATRPRLLQVESDRGVTLNP